MSYEPDDSAERVSRYRRHAADDHSQCLVANCKQRRELEFLNESHLLALAVFEELAGRGMDAETWFGSGYGEARAWPTPRRRIGCRKRRTR